MNDKQNELDVPEAEPKNYAWLEVPGTIRTVKLKITGGWLYSFTDVDEPAMVFVPDNSSNTKTVPVSVEYLKKILALLENIDSQYCSDSRLFGQVQGMLLSLIVE